MQTPPCNKTGHRPALALSKYINSRLSIRFAKQPIGWLVSWLVWETKSKEKMDARFKLSFEIGRTIEPAQLHAVYADSNKCAVIAHKRNPAHRYCGHVHRSVESLSNWLSESGSTEGLCPACAAENSGRAFRVGKQLSAPEEERDLVAAIERAEVEWEKKNPKIVIDLDFPVEATEKWRSPLAKKRYLALTEFLGPPKAAGEDSSGNFAVWISRGKNEESEPGWYRIELRDRARLHWVPQPHVDFLKLTIHRPVPAHRLDDVLRLSQSLSYEPTTGRLSAMCHFMGANIATLALALDLVDGRYDLHEAHRVYGPMIASTLNPTYGRAAYFRFLKQIKIEFDAEHFPAAGSLFDGVGPLL